MSWVLPTWAWLPTAAYYAMGAVVRQLSTNRLAPETIHPDRSRTVTPPSHGCRQADGLGSIASGSSLPARAPAGAWRRRWFSCSVSGRVRSPFSTLVSMLDDRTVVAPPSPYLGQFVWTHERNFRLDRPAGSAPGGPTCCPTPLPRAPPTFRFAPRLHDLRRLGSSFSRKIWN